MSRRVERLYDQLAQRLALKEHASLLKDVLEWFDEGGAKKVKDEVKKQVDSTREG